MHRMLNRAASRMLALVATAFIVGSCASIALAAQISTDDWPQLLHDNAHSSVSTDRQLSATTAAKIGVGWMTALRSPDIGSPVAVLNQASGKTIVYIGDERGDVLAFDEATGASLWGRSVGFDNSVRASPLIAPDGSVWVATAGATPAAVIKLDGLSGKALCSLSVPIHVNASLMLATPPGGVATIYTATNHTPLISGEEVAVRESDCAQIWTYDDWLTLSGAWATPVYGLDSSGKGRVIVGTADPDSTMYSLDASTGVRIWDYSALNPPDGEFDIGAAATVSAPGTNGFADGALYFPSKYGVLYALNFTTGKLIWQYNFNKAAALDGPGRSAAALYKTNLVFGMGNGVEDVDAVTGKLLWHYIDARKQEVISSPAVTGPAGAEIVVCADVTGLVTVLRLSDGSVLYTYQTGNYVTSSPAIVNGHILIDSADGFLYDFEANGANEAAPKTSITSPATGSKLGSGGATVTVEGSATESGGAGVTGVELVVQRGGPQGNWFNGTTGQWVQAPVDNKVPVANPGTPQSTWSFTLPVLPSGSAYEVTANAVAAGGQVDRAGAQTTFTVAPNAQSPQLTISSSLVPPATSFLASGSGFGANELVDFILQKGTLSKARASSSGSVASLALTVPSTAGFGESTLTAMGETSHKTTSATLDITNIWTQAGYDSEHTGAEAEDPILGNSLQNTKNGFLTMAWSFDSKAAIEAPPAVYAGTAYVANVAGALSAVDTYGGAPLWTYVLPSKAPIHGAPAIVEGKIVVGADDGSLYTVAAASGTALGALALDGVPTSPSVIAGTIYTGTDNGTVYAIDAYNGTVVWSANIGAPISLAPAADYSSGVLFVGDGIGHVTELRLKTGKQIAQFGTVGAAVTATPTISNGRVLIGSADGFLRTFSESTGQIVWKYNAGSPVLSLAADGDDVYLGTEAGVLTCLTERSGGFVFTNPQKLGAAVGIAHAPGVSAAAFSQGSIAVAKDDQGGRLVYSFATGAPLSTQPVILDGTVFVGGENQSLLAFTNNGQAPIDVVAERVYAQLRAAGPEPARWTTAYKPVGTSFSTHAFAPHGRRDFPIHLDRSPATVTASSASDRIARQTYLIGWAPVRQRAAAFIERARVGAIGVAGVDLDTDTYPSSLDDAAVQREIARAILNNGWRPGRNSEFLVLTAGSPVSQREYCSYHSAFFLNGILSAPVAYGVVPAGTTENCGPFLSQVMRESNEFSTDPFAQR